MRSVTFTVKKTAKSDLFQIQSVKMMICHPHCKGKSRVISVSQIQCVKITICHLHCKENRNVLFISVRQIQSVKMMTHHSHCKLRLQYVVSVSWIQTVKMTICHLHCKGNSSVFSPSDSWWEWNLSLSLFQLYTYLRSLVHQCRIKALAFCGL